MLANMKITFTYRDEEMLRKKKTLSYKSPKLYSASVVWSHTRGNIRSLEEVQGAATRWTSTLTELSYEERLRKLSLSTLEERKTRRRDNNVQMEDRLGGTTCTGLVYTRKHNTDDTA